MFVGEAPGRLGADSSELPFHGDKSGHNFEALLEQVGLSRYDSFVTNSVLCNPKDEDGNNATPTPTEVANCSPFLTEQLQIVEPAIVVTLGAVALRATDLIERHGLSLRTHVRTSRAWGGRILIPAYHPGQRAMIHRSFANQLADYQFIAETMKRLGRGDKRRSRGKRGRVSEKVGAAAQVLLQEQGKLSYFALHKLLFLAEVRHLEENSERLTDAYYVRQKDGPYCVELHSSRLQDLIPGSRLKYDRGGLIVSWEPDLIHEDVAVAKLNDRERETLRRIATKYGSLPPSKLKTATYLTQPMRELLRREKVFRLNLFNSAILPRM